MKRYISFSQLQAKLGNRSRSSLYRDCADEDGWLPKPVKLGGRLYWAEDAVDAAIDDLSN